MDALLTTIERGADLHAAFDHRLESVRVACPYPRADASPDTLRAVLAVVYGIKRLV